MKSRLWRGAQYVGAALLPVVWLYVWIRIPAVKLNPLRDMGVPLALLRGILTWSNLVRSSVPYVVTGMVLWRLGASKHSPLRRIAFLPAAAVILTQLLLGANWMLRSRMTWVMDVDTVLALPLLYGTPLIALLIALEPHVTAPLSRKHKALAVAGGLAALLLAVLLPEISGPEPVAALLGGVSGLIQVTAYGPYWLMAGSLTAVGFDSFGAFLLSSIVWIPLVWYLISRAAISWWVGRKRIASRPAIHDAHTLDPPFASEPGLELALRADGQER